MTIRTDKSLLDKIVARHDAMGGPYTSLIAEVSDRIAVLVPGEDAASEFIRRALLALVIQRLDDDIERRRDEYVMAVKDLAERVL